MHIWIAADKGGNIFAFNTRPIKEQNLGLWIGHVIYKLTDTNQLPEGVFPSWEDDEPLEVMIKFEVLNFFDGKTQGTDNRYCCETAAAKTTLEWG